MKIIDCFIFYNELDILHYRLNILKDIVDYFIIVESTHTFVGKEKTLYFENNKHLFDEFKDKIIHIVCNDMPHIHPNINYVANQQWNNEKHQRNCIHTGIDIYNSMNGLTDEDILLISDVDEIPDKNTLSIIKNNSIPNAVYSLEMGFYYYNLTSKILNNWDKAKLVLYKMYKELVERGLKCDDIRQMNAIKIRRGGWHLSYFGDSNFIQNKIQQFSHQELNTTNFTDLKKIEKRIKNSTDLFDRSNNPIMKIPIDRNNYLPYEYETYLKDYI